MEKNGNKINLLMKLSHFLPISAVIAGCSSITPVPQKASLPVAKSSPSVTQSIDDCIAGVEVILEHPYGDGLTLQIERADSCTDPLGEFLHRKKIQRRGQIIFAPTAKLPAGVRQRTLDVLVTR